MPVARLAALGLLFCSLPSFAQVQSNADQSSKNLESKNSQSWFDEFGALSSSASSTEPWRIVPQQSSQADAAKRPLDQLSNGQVEKALQELTRQLEERGMNPSQHPWIKVSPDGKIMVWGIGDASCFSIHSYVVARDNKNSDATHKVSESTCQPAARYGVHTAEQRMQVPSTGNDH